MASFYFGGSGGSGNKVFPAGPALAGFFNRIAAEPPLTSAAPVKYQNQLRRRFMVAGGVLGEVLSLNEAVISGIGTISGISASA